MEGQRPQSGSVARVRAESNGTRLSAGRLSAMPPKLSNLELEILRKLVNGAAVSVPSQLRIRLELAGLIREGARGILVTGDGRRLANQMPAPADPGNQPAKAKVAVDKRGRRMPLRRKSVF